MDTDLAEPAPAHRITQTVVWILIACTLVVKAGGFAWDYLSFYVSEGTGHGTTAAGIALTIFGLGWCTGQAINGLLTDRLGERTTLIVMMMLSAVACSALALARTLPELLGVAFCLGLTMESQRPAVASSINAAFTSDTSRTRAQTTLYWAMNLGIAVCGGGGGFFAEHYGYRPLFVINALVCLLFAAVAARVLPARPRTTATAVPSYRSVLADPALRWMAVVSLSTMICGWGLQSVLPLLIASDRLPPAVFGTAMVANTVTVLILTPILGELLVGRTKKLRFPIVPVLAAGSAILGLGITLASTQHSVLGYSIAAVTQVPGEILYSVALGGFIATAAPAGAVGRYQAVVSGAGAMASLPPVGIALALNTGGRLLVTAVLASCAMAAVAACFPLARSLRRTEPKDSPLVTAHEPALDPAAGLS